MPDFASIKKNASGWRPGTGEARSHVKAHIPGMGKGKGKDSTEAAHNHVSRPLTTLKDPSTFGPPPKHGDFYGGAALSNQTTPARIGAPPSHDQEQAARAQEEEVSKPKAPSLPFRADTTGLSTTNLPPPPVRRDGADGRMPVSDSKPKPSLPPRLPTRQPSTMTSKPLSPSPTHSSSIEPPAHKGILNQGSLSRLGAAGVSVSGFGIGEKPALLAPSSTSSASPAMPARPLTVSPSSPTPESRLKPSSAQLNELSSRFSRLGNSNSTNPPPSEASPQGTTFAQKQAALRTASSFRNDPSSVSLSDARTAASTANNFRERHGEQVASGLNSANRMNTKYGMADKIGQHGGPKIASPPSAVEAPGSPSVDANAVASGWNSINKMNTKYGLAEKAGHYGAPSTVTPPPVVETPRNQAVETRVSPTVGPKVGKKQPPPPPKKKPALSAAPAAGQGPPPLPLASKPKPNAHSAHSDGQDLDLDLGSLWFTKTPIVFPPPVIARLPGSRSYNYTYGWSSTDGIRRIHTFTGIIRHNIGFAMTKIHLTWDASNPALTIKAEQRHIPPPRPLSPSELEGYREQYSDRIASWCESKLGTQVGNGECWTLANEGLAAIKAEEILRGAEPCMISQSYYHGSIIYEYIPPKPSEPRSIEAAGVARGDILQFLSAHFKRKDGRGESFAGAPDHTAVITAVERGGALKVVESNTGGNKTVKHGRYDMSELVSGEVRVFRAVSETWAGNMDPTWP